MILYKYLSPERIDVLNNLEIRFTQVEALNDPFEGNPNFKIDNKNVNNVGAKVFVVNDIFDPTIRTRFREHLDKSIKHDPNFSLNAIILSGPDIDNSFMMEGFRASLAAHIPNSMGVLSLTETPDNNLMWSHYGFNNQGYAIGFNSNHPFFSPETINSGNERSLNKIFYSQSRPSGYPESLSFKELFLTKSIHWEYENEWRYAKFLKDCVHILDSTPFSIYLYPYPAELISEVILGCNASQSFKKDVINILSNNNIYSHVKLKQVKLSNTFDLEILEI
ncbi:DUF2971 domain-containing protein [Mucilaginibacter defluvii]|uniref:DUF2971 domain-containing protein n=1 Tax=Mucilaginibacter defluvii TaxID=1196019 RepID=A0ABP9FUF0_9SPHI